MKLTHKQKSLIFKMLDKFPIVLGMWLYHKLQEFANNGSLENKIKAGRRSFFETSAILNSNGMSLKDTVCVEMGSGWLPVLPYFLLASGEVKKVYTYDVNEHYQPSKIIRLNKLFQKELPDYSFHFSGKYQLTAGVEYFPKTSVAEGDLSAANFIFSRFVLEHVPLEVIRELHKSFSEKITNDCYVLHLISPCDHRAYTDKLISLYDFLQYSNEEWDKIQTTFDYHNRLRLPHYIEVFEEHFDIVSLKYTSLKESDEGYSLFKEVLLHDDYMHFSEEELTAGSIRVLLKKRINRDG